jgi:DDE superfamily endonuclease
VTEPGKHGPPFSVLSALGVEGLWAPCRSEGALTSEVCPRSVEQLLVPWLRPGHHGWLDNVQFHCAPKARAALAAPGARVCSLPTYSPAFPPLAAGISKIKERLRTATARPPRPLTPALAHALEAVTPSDIHRGFTPCGSVFPLE